MCSEIYSVRYWWNKDVHCDMQFHVLIRVVWQTHTLTVPFSHETITPVTQHMTRSQRAPKFLSSVVTEAFVTRPGESDNRQLHCTTPARASLSLPSLSFVCLGFWQFMLHEPLVSCHFSLFSCLLSVFVHELRVLCIEFS